MTDAIDPDVLERACPLANGAPCAEIGRVYRHVDARVETAERNMVGYITTGFSGINGRLDSVGNAIGELRDGLREEVTAGTQRDNRVSHAELTSERALLETAKLGARKGRRKGQIESAAITLLGALAYAVARHYGVPLP